ncbi:uncharacterized protein MICPUCDRAFT_7568, partial [Micromonas pusilla CCMP1545]
ITRLYDEREAMEKEMAAISARLSRDGAPGMRGALVDDEGFPIPDVDLYAVRADRGRYATLRNDHDDITDAIERAMASLHAVASATRGVGAVDVNATMNPRAARPPAGTAAFAVVDEMHGGSPAASAGLRLHDRVIAFGGVERGAENENILPRVAALLAAKEGAEVPVWVTRGTDRVRVFVTPAKWEGRGLLGCHMRPL